MERDELKRSAQNVLEQAREAKERGNLKLAKKLLEGARRLDRWAAEGMPREYA